MCADDNLYYGIGEQDELDCEFAQCVESYVDYLMAERSICLNWAHFGIQVPPLPTDVEVTVYRQGEVSTEGLRPLETLLEQLEDRHGYSAEHDPVPTPGMVQAERDFLSAVADEYRRAGWVRECAPVRTERVNLSDWLPGETTQANM